MMPSDLLLSVVTGVFLILLLLLTRWRWRRGQTVTATTTPRATRDPKPFAGLTRKPECELCEPGTVSHPPAPSAPPPRMSFTRGRRRHVETTGHFCPDTTCAYHGRVGWGNIRANGHPHGRRWRQLVCLSCQRHFLETHGTPFHGKQVEPDKLGWAIAGSCISVVRLKSRDFSKLSCQP
jgi:hypothetical protein